MSERDRLIINMAAREPRRIIAVPAKPLTPTSPTSPAKPKRKRPPRKRGSRKVRACSFPECDRPAFGDGVARFCCLGHRALSNEFRAAERVSRAVPAGACWAELVTASDAFTAYLRYFDAVRESARMDDIDDDAWRAIVNGGDLDRGQAG